jgi:hypothetical protein
VHVQDAWNTLCAYGLPDGPPRAPPASIDFQRIREALSVLAPSTLQPGTGVILLAYLEGWRHHWPSRFASELGTPGDKLCRELSAIGFDRNRFLKLRRIAVENLAAVL